MAYVPMNQDDEEKRRAAAGGAPGSFGYTTQAAGTTQPKFVNVADYLSKNQEGSAKIGEAASAKLAAQRDEAGTQVTDSGSKFNQDVSSGTTNLDQGLLTNALSTPESFVQDPNNTAKFLAMRDASYKGPASIQGTDYFAPADTKVTGLKTTAEGLGTEAGRNELVQSLSAHPTQGKTSLNQLLLQGNPDAANKIQDTAGTFKSVEDQWAQILANAPSTVDAARTATDAARTTTQSQLGDTTNAFKTGLTNKLNTATNERNASNVDYQNIENSIANNGGYDLTQKQLDELGISDAYPYLSKLHEFNGPRALNYYGAPVNLSQYSTGGAPNSNVPTMGGVASPEDYAREAALQQLSGNDLGLADTPETPYTSNGRLPTVDYRGAFDTAGSSLKGFDTGWTPKVAGYSPDDISQLFSIQARQGITSGVNGQPSSGTPTDKYYTDPNQSAAAQPGPGTWTPPGTDTSQPPPYPNPTSNPPSNLINPVWDPYNGVWNGARLAGDTPDANGHFHGI